MEGEECIKEAYQELRILKTEWSDIIPSQAIHSGSKYNRYKCRKAWWCMIRDRLDILEERQALPLQLLERYRLVWKRYVSLIHREEYGIKPENIIEANELLSDVLDTLEARLSPNSD